MRRILLAAAMTVPLAAGAEEVRIGYGAAVTSMDPHYHALTPNVAVHQHLFGALVGLDARLGLKPELAESWRAVDDTTWEFKLRRDARFHDGSPLDAAAVKFSLERAKAPGSINKARWALFDNIVRIDIPDPHTVVLVLAGPDANLLLRLGESGAVVLHPDSAARAATRPVGTGEEDSVGIPGDVAGQPLGVRAGADEHEEAVGGNRPPLPRDPAAQHDARIRRGQVILPIVEPLVDDVLQERADRGVAGAALQHLLRGVFIPRDPHHAAIAPQRAGRDRVHHLDGVPALATRVEPDDDRVRGAWPVEERRVRLRLALRAGLRRRLAARSQDSTKHRAGEQRHETTHGRLLIFPPGVNSI